LNAIGKSKKVFARSCKIKIVDNRSAREFLTKNHIQGPTVSQFNYGLYFEGDLIQLVTFGSTLRKHILNGKNLIELKRLSTLCGYTVVGGASKLLKYAINNLKAKYDGMFSFCDLRWGTGKLYKILGFELIRESRYSPHYFKKQKRYRNIQLRKKGIEKQSDKTEKELRLSEGYLIIHDCGHQHWRFIFDKEEEQSVSTDMIQNIQQLSLEF